MGHSSNDLPCHDRARARTHIHTSPHEKSLLGSKKSRQQTRAATSVIYEGVQRARLVMGQIDQTAAGLKVWRRATVKRPTWARLKNRYEGEHVAIGLTTLERVRASCLAARGSIRAILKEIYNGEFPILDTIRSSFLALSFISLTESGRICIRYIFKLL